MKCTNFTFKGEEGLDIYTYKWEDENIKNQRQLSKLHMEWLKLHKGMRLLPRYLLKMVI